MSRSLLRFITSIFVRSHPYLSPFLRTLPLSFYALYSAVAFVDEVRKREEERVWKARDDALQAREDARSYLMKQVDEGRQEQIRVKLAASRVEGEEGKLFAAKFIKEAREGIEKEQAEKDIRRRIAEDNNIQLQQQMALREHKEDLERQEIYLANKHMQYIEKKHRERLAEQGGAIRTKFPLKASQWYS